MAIAFDTSLSNTTATVGAGTATLANYTVASGGILIVFVQWNGSSLASGNITGVTYNGVSMTSAGTAVVSGNGAWASSVWYLLNPATGAAHNIVATSGSANVGTVNISAHSYTGASTVSQPDSYNSNSGTNNGGTFTVSTTVVASNCWLVGAYASADDAAPTGNTNCTIRQNPAQQWASADSNATVGTGSQSMIWNQTGGGGAVVGTLISIQPPAVAATPTLALMGVGT